MPIASGLPQGLPTQEAPAVSSPGALPAAEQVASQGLSGDPRWLSDLEIEARRLLESGSPEVWDLLTRQFEARLIRTALHITRGRRIEAAQKLGIGRNTITRKIQELSLDD
jgi:two-component system nitrogen regulation response regulator GlnG